jgi:predicted Zn-dependent protease
MSTHPDPGDREVRTKDLSEGAAAANPTARYIGEAEYKHHINDLVYGDDPRGGYVENGVFYHPELAFEVIFPSGWEVINMAAALYASDPRSASAIQLTIVPSEGAETPDAFVGMLQARGEIVSAAKSLGSVGGWPAWVGAVEFRGGRIRNMHVAWVEREPGVLYQFMAVPFDLRTKEFFRQSLRTFRELKDQEVLNRSPARVFVTRVEETPATLTSVADSFLRLAVPLDEVAFLNNLRENSSIPSGYLLKVVLEPGSQN